MQSTDARNDLLQMQELGQFIEFGPTVNFREALRPDVEGAVAVVQAKDVGQDGTLNFAAAARVRNLPIRGEWPLLKPFDVLLQSRGTSYRSCIVPETHAAMVAAGGLYVLRPDTSRLDPRYLLLYLSLPATQAALRKAATGSHILNVTRDALAALEIALPPLADQRALVELGDLVRRSLEIEQRLHQLRLQQLHALALERAKKAESAETLSASKRSGQRLQRRQTMS